MNLFESYESLSPTQTRSQPNRVHDLRNQMYVSIVIIGEDGQSRKRYSCLTVRVHII